MSLTLSLRYPKLPLFLKHLSVTDRKRSSQQGGNYPKRGNLGYLGG